MSPVYQILDKRGPERSGEHSGMRPKKEALYESLEVMSPNLFWRLPKRQGRAEVQLELSCNNLSRRLPCRKSIANLLSSTRGKQIHFQSASIFLEADKLCFQKPCQTTIDAGLIEVKAVSNLLVL